MRRDEDARGPARATPTGETDLGALLAAMSPQARPGDWFFGTVPFGTSVAAEATVHESEGLSIVVDRREAARLGLSTAHPYRWITLRVHSSLEAVGLTAAVAGALTERGISCNVVAGAFHDHLLVPARHGDEAITALETLSSRARDDAAR
ncbi:MAG: ACT domain-containing protein [Microcella sp.]|uniref:ACT domain-containing protein n=1 Tax=Microcella sp. TaxID=1913979 RepID=UPI003315508D